MITVISDVHGNYDRYYKIIRQKDRYPYTIQLGDFGFKYDTLKNVDFNCHKIVAGNHDNYDKIIEIPHYLGDFGFSTLNGIDFFYYRGAYSIDRQYRTIGIDWWAEEQVSIDQFMKARELYREKKPKIVITHDCPENVAHLMLKPGDRVYQNTTGWALQELFNIHQPNLWIFGHWHQSKNFNYCNTNFVCLAELETYNIIQEETTNAF
jgi:predicted phosphodiesterase